MHSAYELIKEERLDNLNADCYLLKHKKSGARIALISNDDDNKVFYIGFRTPPKDSTGVAHIVEHTVLCGSAKYPVKDPFVELVKGSLNTFLNAMTYPDKTVYPIASCNMQDFKNLMDIYMDAVFNPNIYRYEEIFKQEGWHYELEDKDSDITINGVVYNEMKGAFSSPESVLERSILNSLYPDTTYAIESGGDPEVIPSLTYQEYLDFHSKYYHPCNSYIYLYGDMDMVERLDYLDREYLSGYETIAIDSEIKKQQPFEEARELFMEYPVSAEEEGTKDQAYLTYNVSIGTSLDDMLYQAMDILDYVVFSSSGAPVKNALIHEGIGKDIISSYDGGIYQPIHSVIAKNASSDDKDRFVSVIRETLKSQVECGIDKKALYGAINGALFKFKEADFGSYPKGLILGLQILDSWLYDENQPFMHLHGDEVLLRLKDMVEEGYFENLIQTYFLDNNHASVIVAEPKSGLTAIRDDALKAKLSAYKATLNDEQILALVEDTKKLKAYQEEPSSAEDLRKIPMLKREDLSEEIKPFNYTVKYIDSVPVIHTDIFTNGIYYLALTFEIKGISAEDLPYISFLCKAMGYMDTENYSYSDYVNEINLHTGGIGVQPRVYRDKSNNIKLCLEIETKYLDGKASDAFRLIREIIHTDFSDRKRLKELVDMDISKNEMKFMNSGHSVAAQRALSYFSKSALIGEYMSGIDYYEFIKAFSDDFDGKADAFISRLDMLANQIFRYENLFMDITGKDNIFEACRNEMESLKDALFSNPYEKKVLYLEPVRKNEGFKNAAQIQYVCRAGDFSRGGFEYSGYLKILKVILGYDYFWINVRVKGGAYGCMCNFKRSGALSFVSYRDPNLEQTSDIFVKTGDYIRNFEADEREMTKYIIGTISGMDTPLTYSQTGERNMTAYMEGLSEDVIRRERRQVITAGPENIRALADLVDFCMDQDYLCVVGNETVIEENARLFDSVKTLA